jgi:uncharacterized protein (TIGR00299 family) protein
MSRLLYFDCFSGISGDMVIGALLDAGLPFEALEGALGSLALEGARVGASRVLRAGVSATKFRVERDAAVVQAHGHDAAPHAVHAHDHAAHDEHHAGHTHDHHVHDHRHDHAHPAAHAEHHSVAEMFDLIDRSALSAAGRDRAKSLVLRLGEAEASIHQVPLERVHLHEVGAIDSIIDIVGAVFALEWAGADRIVCSPLNVGGGMVHSAHGLFPVPAPATLKLLGAAPVYGGVVQQELVTPTGALIATGYATSFGPIPPMTVERVGYGAGDRDHEGSPNVLRVLIGSAAAASPGDRVAVLECEIDDMNPQLFGSAMDRLYAAGALEVFYVPVQMKKNRPGTLLTVIAPPEARALMSEVIFRETTTIGVRYAEVNRECLQREVVTVETALGPVRFKVAWHGGRVVNASPEFDDCAALAGIHNMSVKDVQAAAAQAYRARRDAADSRP